VAAGPPAKSDFAVFFPARRSVPWPAGAALRDAKSAFLTPSCRDATYIVRTKNSFEESHRLLRTGFLTRPSGTDFTTSVIPSRPTGSPLRQRILRVAMEVHNDKEMGP
jgi:hypothetical protein